MGSGPAPFSEIGKKARDLLTRDYNFDHKFSLSTVSKDGLGITATGVKVDGLFFGDIGTQFKNGKTAVDVKVNTNSNVSTTITLNEVVDGGKAILSFKLPDHKSGKLDLHYANGYAAVSSSTGLTPAPLLEFSAATGTKDITLGAEIAFDSASASFSKYNAGVMLTKPDFSASLILADKGETLKASYIHLVNPASENAVAAEMVHRFNTFENSFTIGSSHKIDTATMMKTRFSSNGKFGVLCQHEWRPKSLATVSAEYDCKAVGAPTKVGVALALK